MARYRGGRPLNSLTPADMEAIGERVEARELARFLDSREPDEEEER